MKRTICHFAPPIEIYDVLHEAKLKGIKFPEAVEYWWIIETKLNEGQKNIKPEKTEESFLWGVDF